MERSGKSREETGWEVIKIRNWVGNGEGKSL